MVIYKVPHHNLKDYPDSSWDLDNRVLSVKNGINNYKELVSEIRTHAVYIRDLPIETLLDFFDSLAIYWLTDPNSRFLGSFSNLGVNFLINFVRKSNLTNLLKQSLNGNINFLDSFVEIPELQKNYMAHPRGVITHWLAGNVPVLGMISLVQGIISKNANVIKLSKENGLVLPFMAAEIAKHEFKSDKISIKGIDILKSCLFVYCDKDDHDAQNTLSVYSDVRVAWGGREAVESVMSLPRKYGTDDVIFGPKYSFALVGRDSFDSSELEDMAYRLALDTSIFEQQGCNSPHTVFIEKGGHTSPLEFAKALEKAMDKVLKRIPKNPVSADEAYNIVNIRNEYSFTGQVFSSKGTEWTVIYSEDKGLADACYSRVIFVRPVDDKNEILEYIEPKKHQTMGICIEEYEKLEFSKKATQKGIERVTELGKMSSFDYPWDGMFPINRFLRWVSVQ
jgi:hypothetical protein